MSELQDRDVMPVGDHAERVQAEIMEIGGRSERPNLRQERLAKRYVAGGLELDEEREELGLGGRQTQLGSNSGASLWRQILLTAQHLAQERSGQARHSSQSTHG